MAGLSNIVLGTSYQLGEEAMLLQSHSANAKTREAAAIANAVEPRAESAYYDQNSDSEALLRSADRIIINLKSGATFSFPPDLAQGLAGASPED